MCVVDPCPICPVGGAGPESMVAWFVLEGPVREVIHKLKYGDRPNLASPLVELGLTLGDLPTGVVVPVPLGRSRRRQRGYNQAEALARKIATATGRRCLEGLRRVRETDAQVGRSGGERRLALAGAFAWQGAAPEEILLVDDVVTTGATLVECARAARTAGVKCVHTLAAALG
jgi:ComF family protein